MASMVDLNTDEMKHEEKQIPVPAFTLAELASANKASLSEQSNREQVTTSMEVTDNAFAVIADDDTLEPIAPKGSTLIFDALEKAGQAAMFALIREQENQAVKIKLVRHMGGKYMVSDADSNIDAYKEVMPSQICGTVVQIKRQQHV